MRISQPVAPWRILGPGAAANPTLSWEYWNGESWWALGNRDLRDDTANFQKRGGIFFKAPVDIRPTDVGGTTRYWIRARLVGGDYGEPTTIVTTARAPNGGTEQAATRDVSSVRAPYITALRLGYCANEPVQARDRADRGQPRHDRPDQRQRGRPPISASSPRSRP